MEECMWLNTTKIIKENLNKKKPCLSCGYCPYGGLVEVFPLKENRSKNISCPVFGHDCPMFYNGEDFSDFGKERIKQVKDNDMGNKK